MGGRKMHWKRYELLLRLFCIINYMSVSMYIGPIHVFTYKRDTRHSNIWSFFPFFSDDLFFSGYSRFFHKSKNRRGRREGEIGKTKRRGTPPNWKSKIRRIILQHQSPTRQGGKYHRRGGPGWPGPTVDALSKELEANVKERLLEVSEELSKPGLMLVAAPGCIITYQKYGIVNNSIIISISHTVIIFAR